MKSGPCKDCKERKENCHDSCERYISWKREWEAAKAYNKEQTMVLRSKTFWKYCSNPVYRQV